VRVKNPSRVLIKESFARFRFPGNGRKGRVEKLEERKFDEKAETALRLLFENFWILREENPEQYQLIRERERILKRFIDEKFGYPLIVHRHFIKLEKTPVEPEAWMGILDFRSVRDYAMFCCALAFTESKQVDEQFLLSEICEDIKDMYPGEFPIDWTNYNDRKSLIRVIKFMERLSLLKRVEGDIEKFASHEKEEVLYEVTVYARYFMRTFPDDLSEYASAEEILRAEWERQSDVRRKRVYRKLFLSPAVCREGEDDADFLYMRNFRNRLRDDIESHTSFRLELFKNAAFLVADEKHPEFTLFPDQRAISDIVLHLGSLLREKISEFPPDEYGRIRMTKVQFSDLMKELKNKYGYGWSKQYREGTAASLESDVIELLKEWELLEAEEFTGSYLFKPAIGRLSGHYPKDFSGEAKEEVDGGETE